MDWCTIIIWRDFALIKHIFKTDLQKDKNSCAKDFISVHKETLAFKCSPEILDKKEIALV